MIFVDSKAYIEEGILGYPDGEPDSWREFCNTSDYAHALREFIYIIQHYVKSTDNMYDAHLEMLYTDVYRFLHEQITSSTELPTLKMTDDFSEYFYYYGKEEILVEACFQFAIFYLCREYAKISNYFQSQKQLPSKVKERLFYSKQIPTIITINKLFTELLSIPQIKDLYEQSSNTTLAKVLSPVSTINDLKEIFLQNEIDDILNKFNANNKKILDEITQCLFRCITAGKITYKRSLTFAVGDGSKSLGFMGIENLGLLLFNYTTSNGNVSHAVSKRYPVNIKNNDIVHLYSFGYNSRKISSINIKLKKAENTLIYGFDFEGNRYCYNGLRPIRDISNTYPTEYGLELNRMGENDNETNGDWLERDKSYTNFIYNTDVIANFNRLTNNLEIKKDSNNENIEVQLVSGESEEPDDQYDEFFLIMNIVPALPRIVVPIEDLFENNKFELTKEVADSFFSNSEDNKKLLQIIEFLSTTQNPTIYTSIKGYYVGKRKNNKIILPDETIKPVTTNGVSKEDADDKEGYEKLRHSEATIKLNKKDKILTIEVWSTTSPRRSRLDNNLTSEYKNENGDNIDSNALRTLNEYTNAYKMRVNGKSIPIYNQPLAMLRSMGVLEAIAKQIIKNTTNNVEVVQEAMNKMMAEAVAEDKSWEIRGKVGKNYQVKNKITYKDYKKMKWYRDCDEYELYDHSINFDTIENNNN